MHHSTGEFDPYAVHPVIGRWAALVRLLSGLAAFALVSLGLMWLFSLGGPLGSGVAATALAVIAGLGAALRVMR